MITVSFDLAPSGSLGAAIRAVNKVKEQLHMPPGLAAGFQGTAASFTNSLSNEPLLVLAALVAVYIVLGVLYESFIHPVTILSTLPSAGVGALLALMLFGQDLDVVALIGIILLIGIVTKNGIMMVDFALDAERTQGKNSTDAIYEACQLRFRPILMTTMAALLAGLPLAMGSGSGSELRRPLGIAMVGGLILSQLLTLYTTPVIYIFFDGLSGASTGRNRRPLHEPLGTLHRTTRRHDAARRGGGHYGRHCVRHAARSAAAAGGLSHHFGECGSAGRERGHHGILRRDAAGATVQPHCGGREMTSASSLGSTQVTLQFDLSRDIDGAARDVEAAINASRSYLPANLPGNPTYRKVNPADSPVMIFGLTSDKYAPAQMYDAASTVIEQKLSQISGVGQVNLGGGALPAVRVDANPTQLAHYGLSLANLQTVLSAQNANLPKGQLSNGDLSADILANDQIIAAAQYRNLVVGYSNGAAVRLADVADVTDSVQNIRAAGYLNGKRAVMLIIFRQPGANIIQTVDNIRAALPTIKASINSGIDITVVLDRTTTIRASVNEVERTLLTSTLLVVMVVFRVPAQHALDLHPGHCHAGLADRYLRGHVPVQLQHRQSVADGADHRHGLCRG